MISSLKLTNFKCFKDQSVPLRPLTLLTGINGMGKSTVLQALLLLRQSHLQGMLPLHGLLITGELIDLGTAGDILHRGADTDELGIEVVVDAIPLSWRFKYSDPFANVLPVLQEPQNYDTTPVFSTNFHYLMAERIGPRHMYETSTYAVQQERRIGRDGRYAVAFLEANAHREVPQRLRLPSEGGNGARAQVEAWLKEISPGAQLNVTTYPELGRLTLGMNFGHSIVKGRPFSAVNVGFGLSYVLSVLVAILASPQGSLILVENPEAHLNPKGQVAMGRLLALAAESGIQLLIETHSDHILNGIRIAVKRSDVQRGTVAIHYFDREEKQDHVTHVVHSPEIDHNGRIENWPSGFFDQWEQSLDQLLS